VIRRGEIWWASLPVPSGSEPGYRRPVVVVQSEAFNRSRIQTVIVAAVTSNLRLALAPGNIRPSRRAGLPRDSVVNVSQLLTVDRSFLREKAGKLSASEVTALGEGLRLVLAL